MTWLSWHVWNVTQQNVEYSVCLIPKEGSTANSSGSSFPSSWAALAVHRPSLLYEPRRTSCNTASSGLRSARDLAYVRRRYISVDAMRRAIAIVADGTLHARNPAVWGTGTTACAPETPSTLAHGIRTSPRNGMPVWTVHTGQRVKLFNRLAHEKTDTS